LRATERYLFSLTITYTITTFALSFFSANTLDLYISIFIIEYFIITLHNPINPESQKIINYLSYGLFILFILIMSFKVIEILGGNFL
jgi:hypothetical protein